MFYCFKLFHAAVHDPVCTLRNHSDTILSFEGLYIFIKYLLCSRIHLEELTPYRSFIRKFFTEEEKASFCEKPETIWNYIESAIQYEPQVDYKNSCATPVGCLKMKHGSSLSQYILFVAVCRSLGIPARLDRVTLKPEYYSGKTIEVLNTDAEGRLVLSDAVSYGIRKEGITKVLDIAGTAWCGAPTYAFESKGATGAGVTTLYYLMKEAQNS